MLFREIFENLLIIINTVGRMENNRTHVSDLFTSLAKFNPIFFPIISHREQAQLNVNFKFNNGN